MTERVSRPQAHPNDIDDSETIVAEARERQRGVVLVLVGALAILWVVCWVAPWLRLEADLAISTGRMPASAACTAVLMGLGLLSFAVAAFGVYAFRFGRTVAAEKRFPPLGAKVIRETRVVTGTAAEALGRVQAFLGASLIVLAVLLFVLVLYGLTMLSFF